MGRPGPRSHLRLGGELDHRLSEIQLRVGRPHSAGARSGPAPAPTPAPAPARDPAPAPRPPLLSQKRSLAPRLPARRRPRPRWAPPRWAPPSRGSAPAPAAPRTAHSRRGESAPGIRYRRMPGVLLSQSPCLRALPSASERCPRYISRISSQPPGPATFPASRSSPPSPPLVPTPLWAHTFSACPLPQSFFLVNPCPPYSFFFFFSLSICFLGSFLLTCQTHITRQPRCFSSHKPHAPEKQLPGLMRVGGPSWSHSSFLATCLP